MRDRWSVGDSLTLNNPDLAGLPSPIVSFRGHSGNGMSVVILPAGLQTSVPTEWLSKSPQALEEQFDEARELLIVEESR